MKEIILFGFLLKTVSAFAMLPQETLEVFLAQFGKAIQVNRDTHFLPYKIQFTHPELLSEEKFIEKIETSLFQQECIEINPLGNQYFSFQKNFEKYSKEIEITGYCSGTSKIRTIDYDSILDGLGEKYKTQAKRLENDENLLTRTIEDWLKTVTISYSLEIGDHYSIPYILCFGTEEIKNELKKVFFEMTKYKKSKEMLILTLVLKELAHKSLDFHVSGPYSYAWEPILDSIEFGLRDLMKVKIQGIYHELNHRIHDILGIRFGCELTGEMNSQFEQDLFEFPDVSLIRLKKIFVKSLWNHLFMCEDFYPDSILDVQKSLKTLHLNAYWEQLEEVWNIIGFANIFNQIYINKMSDLDFIENCDIHHYSCLTNDREYLEDRITLGCFKKFFKKNDSEFWAQVVKTIDQINQENLSKEVGDASNSYPKPKAWKYLMNLHGLKSDGFDYIDVLGCTRFSSWKRKVESAVFRN